MNTTVKYPKGRKSIAIDFDTYNLLDAICKKERRTIIDQLAILIENEHARLFSEVKDEH